MDLIKFYLIMWKFWSKFLIIFCFAGGSVALSAQQNNANIQPKINSPYSRFGLGDPVDQFLAGPAGMAGLSAAFNDAFLLNLQNPASLTYLQATAFEVGAFGKYSQLESGTESDGVWSGNLNYLALGFPLKNPINKALDRDRSPWGFGMSLSLQPYTNVGYDIETKTVVEGADLVTNYLKGTGGTYKVQWGNGARYKDFAVGANIGYLFGKITNSRLVEFDSLAVSYNSEFRDEISIGGFYWNVGVQYTYYFKEPGRDGTLTRSNKRLIFGAYGNAIQPFSTKTDQFYSRTNFEYGQRDTIQFEDIVEERGQLPAEFTIGVMYEEISKLRLGFEYYNGLWSQYENEGKEEQLSDAWKIRIGGEFIPDFASYNNYFRRMRYRLGFVYGTDPRSLGGDQLTTYSLNFGFGFPIVMPRQQISFVNFGVEVGQFGIGSEILKENYVKMTLGFTLNDNTWFFKRKFN